MGGNKNKKSPETNPDAADTQKSRRQISHRYPENGAKFSGTKESRNPDKAARARSVHSLRNINSDASLEPEMKPTSTDFHPTSGVERKSSTYEHEETKQLKISPEEEKHRKEDTRIHGEKQKTRPRERRIIRYHRKQYRKGDNRPIHYPRSVQVLKAS